ncbi:MAG TPA: SpoIIE family protein phosphatase [Bacteroidia bacterium]|jgi:serine phosphatase RsbU (regulator of sigma subunit)|nr:SpoIIE family protein phosphatase [Bacteroidia bacterium]
MKKIAVVLLFLISTAYRSQSRHELDSLLNSLKKNPETVVYYERALKAAKQLRSKNLTAQIYQNYAALLKKNKDFKKAYYYLNKYSTLKDTILSEEKNKSMAEMQTRFDTDSQEKEITLLTKNKDIQELKIGELSENIRKQKVTIYASVFGIALMLVLTFFVLNSYREKRKANLLLEEKNSAISKQKQILEEKNTLITHSIEYAKNIQDIILPSDNTFKQLFTDSFVLFIPKDVVSGDFFWLLSENKKETLVAAIDCVGHGVPGAFMALHSYNLLERIVKENKGISPANILDKLNTEVIKSLHQNNEETSSKHGMDLAMVKIKNNELEFAGARNPLVIVNSNGEMTEVKADRMYVGGAIGNFTNNTVKAEKGSMIYMFTDGYADQKGGTENKKFFITVFKQLLTSIAAKNLIEQKEILHKTFTDWKGNHEQMDDILVIGIKI